jgi:hypothetical protein
LRSPCTAGLSSGRSELPALDERQASDGAQSALTALLHPWKAAVTLPLSRSTEAGAMGEPIMLRVDARCSSTATVPWQPPILLLLPRCDSASVLRDCAPALSIPASSVDSDRLGLLRRECHVGAELAVNEPVVFAALLEAAQEGVSKGWDLVLWNLLYQATRSV